MGKEVNEPYGKNNYFGNIVDPLPDLSGNFRQQDTWDYIIG